MPGLRKHLQQIAGVKNLRINLMRWLIKSNSFVFCRDFSNEIF